MKLHRLSIRNLRGIRELDIDFRGKNGVVYGPNGMGKSGIVDAIDFLLTGSISRLTGTGSGELSLLRHGPHVGHPPESVWVEAVLTLPGVAAPVTIKRVLSEPGELEYDKSLGTQLEPVLSLARDGQHVLTRREILRYITSSGGDRARNIQELLKLSEIEDIRKSLVATANKLDGQRQQAERQRRTAEAKVESMIGVAPVTTTALTEFVNARRRIVGGGDIASTDLDSLDLRAGLKLPAATQGNVSINTTLMARRFEQLAGVLSEERVAEANSVAERLARAFQTFADDAHLRAALARHQLYDLGVQVLGDSDDCPLCDSPFEPGALRSRLDDKRAAASRAKELHDDIHSASGTLRAWCAATLESLGALIPLALQIEMSEDADRLRDWEQALRGFERALQAPLERYSPEVYPAGRIARMFGPAEGSGLLQRVEAGMRLHFPEATPELKAWETLAILEQDLRTLRESQEAKSKTTLKAEQAAALRTHFEAARDSVLQKLYDSIKGRFEELYRDLHGDDESSFSASLQPDGAALKFEVDFHGRGLNPPHALHSEGHQDSMGLCLYLALAERLTGSAIELIVLDDVVMSVDSGHRRELCRVLLKHFPGKQFLITTHDDTWAEQLRKETVVTRQQSVRLSGWTVEGGPRCECDGDPWDRIDQLIAAGEIPKAAWMLRHHSESFYLEACDALGAQLRYRTSNRYELGETLTAASSRLQKLLNNAAKSDVSWNRPVDARLAADIANIKAKVDSNMSWVNGLVHFTDGLNLSANDFRPVVEAFKQLQALFVCSSCGECLKHSSPGTDTESLRCSCGAASHNLVVNTKPVKPATPVAAT